MDQRRSKLPHTNLLVNCPACGGLDFEEVFTSQDRLHGIPGNYSYHKCRACGSVFQNPMVIKEDLSLCYPDEYAPYSFEQVLPEIDFSSMPANGVRQKLRKAVVETIRGRAVPGVIGTAGALLARFRHIRERAFFGLVIDECLPKGAGPHHALDLGCGAGWFIKKLQKVGWDVDGLEWNPEAAELARSRTGANVWTGDFMEADLPTGKYDLVVLNHVFEHLPEPEAAIRRIRDFLTKGGRLVLFFPNHESIGARWYGSKWFHWDPPRHLIFPSRSSLRGISKNAGFIRSSTRSRAANATFQWIASAEEGHIGPLEKALIVIEHISAGTGFDTGWETISVLEK